MKPNDTTCPSPHEARVIAAAAVVCERTVHRYFTHLPIRSTCLARIEDALAKLGLTRTPPSQTDHPVGADPPAITSGVKQ